MAHRGFLLTPFLYFDACVLLDNFTSSNLLAACRLPHERSSTLTEERSQARLLLAPSFACRCHCRPRIGYRRRQPCKLWHPRRQAASASVQCYGYLFRVPMLGMRVSPLCQSSQRGADPTRSIDRTSHERLPLSRSYSCLGCMVGYESALKPRWSLL